MHLSKAEQFNFPQHWKAICLCSRWCVTSFIESIISVSSRLTKADSRYFESVLFWTLICAPLGRCSKGIFGFNFPKNIFFKQIFTNKKTLPRWSIWLLLRASKCSWVEMPPSLSSDYLFFKFIKQRNWLFTCLCSEPLWWINSYNLGHVY